MENDRSFAQRGEDAAAAYLERVGMCVSERGFDCEAGHADIVAFDGDELVLVDVVTRRSGSSSVEGVSHVNDGRKLTPL